LSALRLPAEQLYRIRDDDDFAEVLPVLLPAILPQIAVDGDLFSFEQITSRKYAVIFSFKSLDAFSTCSSAFFFPISANCSCLIFLNPLNIGMLADTEDEELPTVSLVTKS